MKFLAAVLFCSVLSVNAFSQAQYEILKDENHPEQHILRGIINKYVVQNDSTYRWYNSSAASYKPDTATLSAFERAKTKVQFVVFGGTWCEDTQFILPKFFKLQEMSGVADNAISFFGVNRAKKSLASITEAFNIKNVPTIIIMKDGKEAGRVVEYGTTGKWDKELADILNKL
ncbi:TlpA family protein disulfide reductase [Ferruginibacter sp.]|nr:thioredoxin family protein [Ferruginibacter sp.]